MRACQAALLPAAAFPALLLSGCSPAAQAILGIDPEKEYCDETDDREEREKNPIKRLEEDGMEPEEAGKEAFKRINEYDAAQKGRVDPWQFRYC